MFCMLTIASAVDWRANCQRETETGGARGQKRGFDWPSGILAKQGAMLDMPALPKSAVWVEGSNQEIQCASCFLLCFVFVFVFVCVCVSAHQRDVELMFILRHLFNHCLQCYTLHMWWSIYRRDQRHFGVLSDGLLDLTVQYQPQKSRGSCE